MRKLEKLHKNDKTKEDTCLIWLHAKSGYSKRRSGGQLATSIVPIGPDRWKMTVFLWLAFLLFETDWLGKGWLAFLCSDEYRWPAKAEGELLLKIAKSASSWHKLAKHDVPNLSEQHRPWLHLIRVSTRNFQRHREREREIDWEKGYTGVHTPVDNKTMMIRLTLFCRWIQSITCTTRRWAKTMRGALSITVWLYK